MDSEEERSRRRRRRERDDEERRRSDRDEREVVKRERYEEREAGRNDTYEDRHRKRRRSRSPDYESSRKEYDNRRSKHRSSGDRSPDHRNSREGSATQITRKSKGPLPSQEASFRQTKDPSGELVAADSKEVEKQKPNFVPTGLLAAESNSITQVDGTKIILKYHEPPEARKPPAMDEWKLFVFKGPDIIDTIELSTRSCWLVGREVAVVDLAAEHPSISKQHGVIQFRFIEKRNEYGDKVGRVRPYLIDLESANGTMLNKEVVPASRYLELRDKDMIQFGHSTRDYVLMLPQKS